MAKPRINPVDYYQLVIDSLLHGPKKPSEIEKYIFQKVRDQYEDTPYILSEEEKNRRVKRQTIRIRYIEYILHDLKDKGEVAQEKPFGKYFLTDRIFEKPKFSPENIFGEKTNSRLHGGMNALLNNPFVSLDEDNSEEEYFDATILFRFANDLGDS